MNLWGLALTVASLDWLALWHGWRRLDYLAKPGVILILAVWLGSALSRTGSGLLFWFTVGLLFSLLGDVLLMLPRERFTGGLIAFLLGHLGYILGLNLSPPTLTPTAVVMVIPVAWITGWLFNRIRRGLIRADRTDLLIPVGVYSLVIALMWLSALLTLAREDWGVGPALWVAVGATLFFGSDALLAWNRFIQPVSHGRLKVRVVYHLGQIVLAGGGILQALG